MGGALSYFICGLPRSMTAWLSVFMSQSGQYCYHDGINGCHSIEEYIRKVNFFGDSTTGFALIDFKKYFPRSRIIIIDKNEEELEDCIEWCNQVYGSDSREEIIKQHDKLMSIKGLHVNQSDIAVRLRDIWEFLVEKEWLEQYANIINFNIQCNPYAIDIKAAQSLHESLQQNL